MKFNTSSRKGRTKALLACWGLMTALMAPLMAQTYTLEHMSTNTCGAVTDDPYYYAYNAYPGFQYQFVTFATEAISKNGMAIAGRTTNCKAVNPTGCTSDIGAFVMLYNEIEKNEPPDAMFVMSHVTTPSYGDVGVTGFLGIKIWNQQADATKVVIRAFVVFETVDKSLVVARITQSSISISTFNNPAKPVCNFNQSQLVAFHKKDFSLVVNHCESDEIVGYAVEGNSKVQKWTYKPEYRNSEKFESISIAQKDWGLLNLSGILTDPSGNRSLFIQQILDWTLETKWLIKMDAAFESTYGAELQIQSSLSTHDADHGFSIVLHQKTRGMFVIIQEKWSRFYIKTYTKAGCSFEVQSVTNAWNGNMYISLKDVTLSEFYIFQYTGVKLQKISFPKRTASSFFDWDVRVTNVVVSSTGIAIGYSTEGLGYALKSSTTEIPERCVNMLLTDDPNLVEFVGEVAQASAVDNKDLEWRVDDDQTEYGKSSDQFDYQVTSFAVDPKVNNPCKLYLLKSQESKSVAPTDTLPVTTKIQSPLAFKQGATCPDGSSAYGVKVIITSIFNEQTYAQGSTEIKVTETEQDTISVTANTNEGSFIVQYNQGIPGESDTEILSLITGGTAQPLYGLYPIPVTGSGKLITVTVGSVPTISCNNWLYSGTTDWSSTIWASPGPLIEVEVGSKFDFSFIDIENGSCPYTIFVDSNKASTDSGDAWDQFKVSLTQPEFSFDSGAGIFTQTSAAQLTIDASAILAVDAIVTEVPLTVTIAQYDNPSAVLTELQMKVKLKYCQAFDSNLATIQTVVNHYTILDQTQAARALSRNQNPLCAKTIFEITSTGWQDSTVHYSHQITQDYVEVIYKAQIASADARAYTITVKETSEGYPTGFTATRDLVIDVKEFPPCDPGTGFLSIDDFQEHTFSYYSQSNSTLNINIGGTTGYMASTEYFGYYNECPFDTSVVFECKDCIESSDEVKLKLIDPSEGYNSASQQRELILDNSPYLFKYKHLQSDNFVVRTTHVGEYYVKYTATPRWPNDQFYCPTVGNCQGNYQITYTININNNPCVPDPQVNREELPEFAPYRQQTFYFTKGTEWLNQYEWVSNGECGFSITEPYVVDQTDANQIAMYAQYTLSGFQQPRYFVTDGTTERNINFQTYGTTMNYNSNDYASVNSIGGEILLGMDIDFFNSDADLTINWQINALFCEYDPNEFSEDASLKQLTGSDSLPGIEYDFKAIEVPYWKEEDQMFKTKNSWKCSVKTIQVLNPDNSVADPRVFDIVITNDIQAKITVKQNIDDSLEGTYTLKVLLSDIKNNLEWYNTVTVVLMKMSDCTPTITDPFNANPYYKYFVDSALTTQQDIQIQYDGFTLGSCQFEGTIEITCQSCAELTSSSILAQMDAVVTQETLSVDLPQQKHYVVDSSAKIQFGGNIGLSRFGSYTITYTVLDSLTQQQAYSISSEMYVTGNVCNQDAKVDRAIYPLPETTTPLFRKSVIYEQDLEIVFTGISNGDCDWQIQAIPTLKDAAQTTLYEKGASSMELIPVVDVVTNEKVVTFKYTAPKIVDVPDESVFVLEMNVVYVSTAKIETITFEVSLEYCASIWSTEPIELIEFEQATMVAQPMFYTFNKVNQASNCSRTRFEVYSLDKDQQLESLNTAMFELSESSNGQEAYFMIKDLIPHAFQGIYFLKYREIHLTNSADYLERDIKVQLFHVCSLCTIAPVEFGPVQTMIQSSRIVPFSWTQFWLEPILTERKTRLVSQQDCHTSCLPYVKNVTIHTEFKEANQTLVKFSSDSRTAYLNFPKSLLNLRANVTIPFSVNITEQIVSERFESAKFEVNFTAEFVYIVPPDANVWEDGSVDQLIEALFGLPTLVPLPQVQYEFFVGDPVSVQLGEPYFISADELTIEIDLEDFKSFLKFDKLSRQINSLSAAKQADIGLYKLKVNLIAESGRATLVQPYDIAIVVAPNLTKVKSEDGEIVIESESDREAVEQNEKLLQNNSVLDDQEDLDNLPPSIAFRPIELGAAMKEKGMERVQGLVNRQKDLVLEEAIDKGLAEIRLKEITVTGLVYFYFTGPIEFPDNILFFAQESIVKNRKLNSSGRLIDVMTGVGDPNDDYDPLTDERPDILASWDLIDINKSGLTIQLYFNQPLEVSQGDIADKVFIQFNFGQFKDSKGNTMPESILKSTMIPRQAASLAEAEVIDSAGSDAGTASTVTMITGFFAGLLMSTVMNYVWSMLDNLQIVTHLPLIKSKSPANANEFNQFFLDIASLQLVDVNLMDEGLLYYPEGEAYNLEFLAQGYDTCFMIPAMGTVFFLLCTYLATIVTHAILFFIEKKAPKVAIVRGFLSKLLYWGPLSRFFMESYMEMCILAFINMETLFWHPKLHALKFSNVVGLILLGAYLALPIVMVIYVSYRVAHWTDEKFLKINGTLLDGLSTNWISRRQSVLFMPSMYFGRRLAFVLTIVYLPEFFWAVIAVQFAISLSLIMFLQWDRPLENRFAAGLQTFNECTTLMILYVVMCFSNFVGDPEMRSELGLVFVGVVSFNVFCHIVNMFFQICCKTKMRIRNWWHNFRVKEELALRAQREEEQKKDPKYIEAKAQAQVQAQLDDIMEADEDEEEDGVSEYQSFEGEGGKSEDEWIQNVLYKAQLVAPVSVDYQPRYQDDSEEMQSGNKLVPINLSQSLIDSLNLNDDDSKVRDESQSEIIFRQAQEILMVERPRSLQSSARGESMLLDQNRNIDTNIKRKEDDQDSDYWD